VIRQAIVDSFLDLRAAGYAPPWRNLEGAELDRMKRRTAAVWERSFASLDPDALVDAVQAYMRQGRFWPKPADVRRFYVAPMRAELEARENTPQEPRPGYSVSDAEALLAWRTAKRLVDAIEVDDLADADGCVVRLVEATNADDKTLSLQSPIFAGLEGLGWFLEPHPLTDGDFPRFVDGIRRFVGIRPTGRNGLRLLPGGQ